MGRSAHTIAQYAGAAVSLMSEAVELEDDGFEGEKSVATILFGRFMMPDRSEHASQVKGMTPHSATFTCEQAPRVGEHIIAYIEEIGRVEGDVSTAGNGEFDLEFTVPESKRNKIAAKLNWLEAKARDDAAENRRHSRHEPNAADTILTMPDGRRYACEILDMSLSGASLKIAVIPSIGTQVTLGRMRGTVTRVHENGIALEFAHVLDEPTLQTHLS